MDIKKVYEDADKIITRDDFVDFMGKLHGSLFDENAPRVSSTDVVDGCESFSADLHAWCKHRNIPFDEKPTWSLVAWIILAGVLND